MKACRRAHYRDRLHSEWLAAEFESRLPSRCGPRSSLVTRLPPDDDEDHDRNGGRERGFHVRKRPPRGDQHGPAGAERAGRGLAAVAAGRPGELCEVGENADRITRSVICDFARQLVGPIVEMCLAIGERAMAA